MNKFLPALVCVLITFFIERHCSTERVQRSRNHEGLPRL